MAGSDSNTLEHPDAVLAWREAHGEFVDVVLRGVALAGVDLSHTRFLRVRLERVDLTGASLACSLFDTCALDGVTLTGDPEGLVEALSALENYQRGVWEGMFLPGSRVPQPSLLRTHPKTEDRIARLRALTTGAATPPGSETRLRPDTLRGPHPSLVPHVSNPRIRWARFGIYF